MVKLEIGQIYKHKDLDYYVRVVFPPQVVIIRSNFNYPVSSVSFSVGERFNADVEAFEEIWELQTSEMLNILYGR